MCSQNFHWRAEGAIVWAVFSLLLRRDSGYPLVIYSPHADFVVGYDADDTSGDLTAIDGTGVTGSTLTRGTGINDVASGSGQDFNSSMWNSSLDVDNSWQFSFSSSAPYDLTSLQVRAQAFDDGPLTLQLQIDSGSGYVALGATRVYPLRLQPTYYSTLAF